MLHSLRATLPDFMFGICVDDKTFIGQGDSGYRFIQFGQDNIKLGRTASSDITCSIE